MKDETKKVKAFASIFGDNWIYKITKNTIIDFYKKRKDVSVSPETLYMIEDEIDNMNEDISKCISSMIFGLSDK